VDNPCTRDSNLSKQFGYISKFSGRPWIILGPGTNIQLQSMKYTDNETIHTKSFNSMKSVGKAGHMCNKEDSNA